MEHLKHNLNNVFVIAHTAYKKCTICYLIGWFISRQTSLQSIQLKAETMWVLRWAQCEIASQVLEQQLLILVLTESGAHGLVNSQLIFLLLLRWNVFLLLHSEDIAFTAVLGLLHVTLEVVVVDVGWNLHLRQVDACLCGNDIALRDTTQWARVQREWTGDQQQSTSQSLIDHQWETIHTRWLVNW